jgi:hypothetical protein
MRLRRVLVALIAVLASTASAADIDFVALRDLEGDLKLSSGFAPLTREASAHVPIRGEDLEKVLEELDGPAARPAIGETAFTSFDAWRLDRTLVQYEAVDIGSDELAREVAVVEGDMILGTLDDAISTPKPLDLFLGQQNMQILGFIQTQIGANWENHRVPYCLSSGFAGKAAYIEVVKAIRLAIPTWNARLDGTLRWEEETRNGVSPWCSTESTQSRVRFVPSDDPNACHAHVGRLLGKEQAIYLGTSCHRLWTVIHEMGHAVGLLHEHTRPDREDFVEVYEARIAKDDWPNFNQVQMGARKSGEYDYASIMHYSVFHFARGGPPTMKILKPERLAPGVVPGLPKDFSEGDLLAIGSEYPVYVKNSVPPGLYPDR